MESSCTAQKATKKSTAKTSEKLKKKNPFVYREKIENTRAL